MFIGKLTDYVIIFPCEPVIFIWMYGISSMVIDFNFYFMLLCMKVMLCTFCTDQTFDVEFLKTFSTKHVLVYSLFYIHFY